MGAIDVMLGGNRGSARLDPDGTSKGIPARFQELWYAVESMRVLTVQRNLLRQRFSSPKAAV